MRDNQLYLHQEKALRKILGHRNVVIASGTSSGKTECFLLPIYHELLEECKQGKLTPGVRALLLYPMNALANDQLRRLRDIARVMEKKMPECKITFGRYVNIKDTPQTKKEAEEKFRLANPGVAPVKSELLSRDEMQANPPHILITNYAKLEYLLLRPKDSPFFDGEHAKYWKFLVLDEAHIYSGATGIEMAMLIRRLKDRVCRNMEGDLRCIATSATLVKEEQDFGRVAEFATNLFGEEFRWNPKESGQQDIIRGEKIKINIDGSMVDYSPRLYQALDKIIHQSAGDSLLDQCYEAFRTNGVEDRILSNAKGQANGDTRRFVHILLSKDKRLVALKSSLEEGGKNVTDYIKELSGTDLDEI